MKDITTLFAITALVMGAFQLQAEAPLVISVQEFNGRPKPPAYVAKFDPTTETIEKLPPIPDQFIGDSPENQSMRDILCLQGGVIKLVTGTFKPQLVTFDGSSWSGTTLPIWTIAGCGTYGGLTVGPEGNIYLPSMLKERGVVTVYPDNSISRNAGQISPIDLGYANGQIYALENMRFGKVWIVNPSSGSMTTVSVQPQDNRAIAPARNGSFYIAAWLGEITHYDRMGRVLRTLQVNIPRSSSGMAYARFSDIDL